MRGDISKMRMDNDLARQRNFELAHLVAYAFHDPSKMPKFSGDAAPDKAEVSDEVAQAQVRGFFIAMAGGVAS